MPQIMERTLQQLHVQLIILRLWPFLGTHTKLCIKAQQFNGRKTLGIFITQQI